jgi:hypothetical protein
LIIEKDFLLNLIFKETPQLRAFYGFFPSNQLGLKSVLTNHSTGLTIDSMARVIWLKSMVFISSLAW